MSFELFILHHFVLKVSFEAVLIGSQRSPVLACVIRARSTDTEFELFASFAFSCGVAVVFILWTVKPHWKVKCILTHSVLLEAAKQH